MLTEEEQKLRDAEAKLRDYAILEAKILILLHNQGDQDSEALYSKFCIEGDPESRRKLRLALGSLLEKGLIRPSTCVTPGIAIVDELRPITGVFDHDAFIRSHELPEHSTTVVPGIPLAKELKDEAPQAAREAYRLFNDFIRTENNLKGIPESAMVAWDRLRDSLGFLK